MKKQQKKYHTKIAIKNGQILTLLEAVLYACLFAFFNVYQIYMQPYFRARQALQPAGNPNISAR
jgi:hypothetical protein